MPTVEQSCIQSDDAPAHAGRAWLHVVLVFAFMLVNFADKAVVGLSSVPIMRELGLSNTRFGELGSAFFLLFSISGVAGGFLANHVRTKTLLFIMAVVWGLTLLPITLVSSFGLLLVSRVVLGAAEGPAFPVALHAVYKWFVDRRRALPTSIVACGAAFGTGVIAPVVTWIIVHYGWRTAFGTLGAVGLVWAGVWFVLAEDGPVDRLTPDQGSLQRVPYGRLLSSRTAIGVFLAGFGAYWVIALNITWLANYLIKALHIAPARAAWIIVLPSVMQMVLAPSLAALSQFLIRRGVSSRLSRGVLGASCVVTAGVSMICMAFLEIGILKVFLIGLGFSIGSVIFTLGSTLIGEISPAAQRGALLGVTNSIHTLAGLCAPLVMGLVVDVGANAGAGFRNGYVYAGSLVAALGLMAAVLIQPQADLQRFRRLQPADAG
jgi:MFS transporter, ACS family, D-galactonate transporter